MSAAPKLYQPKPRSRPGERPPGPLPRVPGPGEVLTSGRVAKLLRCAPRTVTRWVDEGCLRGYRLPGSRDRRVHQEDLVEFMLSYGMFRRVATAVVADGGLLYRVTVHDRWGGQVARVAPRDAPEGAGLDWLPGDEPRYELKSASPEAFQALVNAGFRFLDGR